MEYFTISKRRNRTECTSYNNSGLFVTTSAMVTRGKHIRTYARVHIDVHIRVYIHTWRLFNSAEWKAPFSRRYARKTGGRRFVSRTSAQTRTHARVNTKERARGREGGTEREKVCRRMRTTGVVSRCTFTRVCVCVRRRSAYTRVNAYRSGTGDVREKEELEVRRGRRAFTVHMYCCPCVAHARKQGCIRSRCTDTRKRRTRRRWSRRKRRMRLNAVGWQRRSAERMVSCRSVRLGVLLYPRVPVKIHRSVRQRGTAS